MLHCVDGRLANWKQNRSQVVDGSFATLAPTWMKKLEQKSVAPKYASVRCRASTKRINFVVQNLFLGVANIGQLSPEAHGVSNSHFLHFTQKSCPVRIRFNRFVQNCLTSPNLLDCTDQTWLRPDTML